MMVEATASANTGLAIAEPVSSPKKIQAKDLPKDGKPKVDNLSQAKQEKNTTDRSIAAFEQSDSSHGSGKDQYMPQASAPELDYENQAHRVRFKANQETGKVAISVINAETSEVIREIPSEEIQRISEKIHDNIGLIFDSNV